MLIGPILNSAAALLICRRLKVDHLDNPASLNDNKLQIDVKSGARAETCDCLFHSSVTARNEGMQRNGNATAAHLHYSFRPCEEIPRTIRAKNKIEYD